MGPAILRATRIYRRHSVMVSFIACESAKKGGFLFASPVESNYIDAGNLSAPLDALTSCLWVKFGRVDYCAVFGTQNQELTLVLLHEGLFREVKGGVQR